MRISDWSSDVCEGMRMPFADPVDSSTGRLPRAQRSYAVPESRALEECGCGLVPARWIGEVRDLNRVGFSKPQQQARSEEHTSELQSLMRISYAVFCLNKKRQHKQPTRI